MATAALERFQSWIKLRERNFSQKTQRAQVYTQDWSSSLGDDSGSRQQRAIPAKNHNEIERARRHFRSCDTLEASCVGRRLTIHHNLILVFPKPVQQFGDNLRKLRLARFGHDAGAFAPLGR